MESFEVGSLVQVDLENYLCKDGEIISIIHRGDPLPPKWWDLPGDELEKFKSFVTVKWTDGSETVENVERLYTRDDEFQRAFRLKLLGAEDKIQQKLDEAYAALSEAVRISDETGVPFRSGISFLSQSYTPNSMSDKFPEVDSDFIKELTGTRNEYDEAGWEHSAVCY